MTYHEIRSYLDQSMLVADMDEVMLQTGAWPRYNPQMVESIVVQHLPGVSVSRLGFDSLRMVDVAIYVRPHYNLYKILWKDSEGHSHGHVWEYPTEVLYRECLGGVTYPLGSAATEAGTVWLYMRGAEQWAELQGRGGQRMPRIPVDVIPSITVGDDRAVQGLKDPMRYQEFPRDGQDFRFWFGDDLEDEKSLGDPTWEPGYV